MIFGHNFWLGGPIDEWSMRLNYILQDLFKEIPPDHIWALQIWSSGVSLKRSCKMQFRRVDLRSKGPTVKSYDQISFLVRSHHWNYYVKHRMPDGWPWQVYGSINLKTFINPSFVEDSGRNQFFFIFFASAYWTHSTFANNTSTFFYSKH